MKFGIPVRHGSEYTEWASVYMSRVQHSNLQGQCYWISGDKKMCKVSSRVNKKQGSLKTADVDNCYNEVFFFFFKEWRNKVQSIRGLKLSTNLKQIVNQSFFN